MAKRKKYTRFFSEESLLTPKLAQTFLDGQIENQRNPSKSKIKKYIHAIKEGLWKLDGSTIKIDWYGQMIDGQQRCKAVVESGKSIRTNVAYGIDPSCFMTFDSGKPRSIGDSLFIKNEKYYNSLANALNLLYEYEEEKYLYGGYVLQTEESLRFLRERPDLRKSLEKVIPAKLISHGIGGFLHYIFSEKDKQKADEFFHKLATAEGFKAKDPINVLRTQLLDNKKEKIGKMRRPTIINITIKAWNIFRKDGTCSKKLTWRSTEKTKNEPYVRAI